MFLHVYVYACIHITYVRIAVNADFYVVVKQKTLPLIIKRLFVSSQNTNSRMKMKMRINQNDEY